MLFVDNHTPGYARLDRDRGPIVGNLRVFARWVRCIVAVALFFTGVGMVNAVADIDLPDGAPRSYLLWGFLVAMSGVALVIPEVKRHA